MFGCAVAFFFVVGIGAILGFFTIPFFVTSSYKPQLFEPEASLAALYVAQVAYFAEYDTYAGGPHCFDLLIWAPEPYSSCAYYCGEDVYDPGAPNASLEPCAGVTVETTNQAFTVCAAGNVDDDQTIGVWSMNDARVLGVEVDDVSN